MKTFLVVNMLSGFSWLFIVLVGLQFQLATWAHAELMVPLVKGGDRVNVHDSKQCIAKYALKSEWLYLPMISVNEKDVDGDIVYRIESDTSGIKAEIFTSVKWMQVNRPTLRENQKTKFRIREVPVYELLLDENSLPPEGKWINQKYKPPEHNVNGAAVYLHRVGAGDTNPVLLRLKIGGHVQPGLHKITITENGRAAVTLCLSVLKDVLVDDSDRVRGIYYRGVTRPNSVEQIEVERLIDDLAFIRSYGFNAITIYNSGFRNGLKYGKYAEEAGLDKAIVMQIPHRKISEYTSNSLAGNWILKDNVYLMGVDEPNSSERLLRHSRVVDEIHGSGGKVFTAMNFESHAKQVNSTKTDLINFHIRSLRSEKYYSLVPKDSVNTYYWQSYLERPALNRLRSGVLLYWSRLDGIFPYAYSHFLENALPYSGDLVENEDEPGVKRKQYLSVYPTAFGRVSTYQWEAFRQGYDDTRALDLLSSILSEVPSMEKRATEISKTMNSMVARIVRRYGLNYYDDPQQYNEQLSLDLDQLRDWVKAKIVELGG